MVAIDVLPDDVLLRIFYFYVLNYRPLDEPIFDIFNSKREIESWQSLVHVCRRWRYLVFGSPRHLNLRLFCIPGRSARKSLDVWPALPLLIRCDELETETSTDDAIAELEYSDRIHQISLSRLTTSHIETLCMAMQVPFPELELLALSFRTLCGPVLPDSFLGGSAPRLRYLSLNAIPFPALPNLLLSATNLVKLWLLSIPHSGYISPEAMAACLSMLTNLEIFGLDFESPQSCPDQETRYPPPPTRSVLPALSSFLFKGVNEYLEDLVSRTDAPQLYELSISLFNDIHFDTPELNQFINRTPILGAYDEAHLIFYSHQAQVELSSHQQPHHKMVNVLILCQVPNWQLSSLAQICNLSLHLLLTMENLYIHERLDSPSDWNDDIENSEWLDLLLPFAAVKNLYLSEKFATHIAPALQELTGGRTTEVLPALQNVLLEGFKPSEPVQEGIARFISARQLTNHTIDVSLWNR